MLYHLKTLLLLGFLNGLMLVIGHQISGTGGMVIALSLALIFNLFAYFYSDTVALKAFSAKPMPNEGKYSEIHEIVEELCSRASIPKPKLWIIDNDMANAFATGRSPAHSSVAVTTGILKILNTDELRGVLAHEISHITNRDILVTSIAAVLVATMSIMIDAFRWRMFWGGGSRDDRNNNSWAIYLAIVILTPLISAMLQLALSRTREYYADEAGAKLSHSPLDLASALQKIEEYSKTGHYMKEEETSHGKRALASLFFSSPFKTAGSWIGSLFSTHPPVKDRVEKLRKMRF